MRQRLTILAKLFIPVFMLYMVLRLVFGCLYYSADHWTVLQVARVAYWGWRMDFTSLFYVNLLFLLVFFFIDPWLRPSWKMPVTGSLFLLGNLPFIAINLVDLVYFRFNHRRATADIKDVFIHSSDAVQTFLISYWYLVLIFLLIALVFFLYTRRVLCGSRRIPMRWPYLLLSLVFFAIAGMLARGLGTRPIVPATPLLHFRADWQPLVNNSTFLVTYSLVKSQSTLQEKHYYSSAALDSLYPVRHQYQQAEPFSRRNVVIFVMESFSKELFRGYRQQSQMPFLDSLMSTSLVFNNAFGNALESNKGLPAILGSLPDITDEPIYLSNYSALRFRGLGTILKEEGYNTSFFMGAEPDHFGFEKLCRMVGIDEYYSKRDFKHRRDQEDGTWGVYDEYFFRYFGETLSARQQPFFSVLFNLSSHYPYKMPAATAVHVAGQQDYQDAVTYVDRCYQQLFRDISKQPWFRNTLFVFVADHGFRYTTEPNEILKEVRIPLFIYDPQQGGSTCNTVVKQLDILPSVLDRLHYARPFTSFGNSYLRQGQRFSVSRLFGFYQFVDSTSLVGYDDHAERVLYHYHYRVDSALKYNLLDAQGPELKRDLDLLRAYLQRTHNSFVANEIR